MHALLVIGGILGLLAIAGGPGLVVFVVRVGMLLTISYFAYALMQQPQPVKSCNAQGFCDGPWNDYAPGTCAPGTCEAKPAAVPPAAPPVGATFHPRPPYYPVLPQPPEPAPPGPGQWGVDDTSGPWPSPEIGPASARADRLLRRLHEAQGLEVGQ